MKGYKANLGLVSGRYGEVERRLLDALALEPGANLIKLPGGLDFQVMYLLRDGLITKEPLRGAMMLIDGKPVMEDYALTPAGREFIERWIKAQPVAADAELGNETI